MNRTKGILFAALSAILFGLTPTFTRIVFANGGNVAAAVLLRKLLAIPVLLGYVAYKKIPFRLSPVQWRDLLLLGVLGVAATGYTLMLSYTYISGGLATTLHFIYPALTALAGWLFFREKLGALGVTALIAITVGVVLFSSNTAAVQPLGVVLALVSGVTYAFYATYLGRSSLQGQNVFLLNLYFMAISAAVYGVVGLLDGGFHFSAITPTGWAAAFVGAFLTSVISYSFFQLGVRYAGGTTTSMMSALEPATSVIFGFLLAGELLSAKEIVGCAAVLIGILLLLPGKKEKPSATEASALPAKHHQ